MAKKNIFAVAVTPDRGLEVAEMNPLTGAIVNYTQRDLETVTIRNVIPDMDVFKELLTDCLITIGAPKGSSLILTLPTVSMGIGNYMTSQTDASIVQLIASDLIEKELIFRDNDPLVATTGLSVSIQSKIVAYNAAVYSVIQELSRIVVELGYKVEAIDNSVASVFRALIHTGKVQTQQDATWLMLLVDSAAARLIKLDGDRLSEYKEEQIMFDYSDATGNCDMVASAMQSYLQQMPTKYLYIVSRTDNVSAEMLAGKLTYGSPIIFLEANSFAKDSFIEAPELPSGTDKLISLDLIGACMYDEALIHFNMFNEELGDVYWAQQPPQLKLSESTCRFLKLWHVKICFFILPCSFTQSVSKPWFL